MQWRVIKVLRLVCSCQQAEKNNTTFWSDSFTFSTVDTKIMQHHYIDTNNSAKLTGPNKFSNIMNKCGHRRRTYLTNLLDSEFWSVLISMRSYKYTDTYKLQTWPSHSTSSVPRSMHHMYHTLPDNARKHACRGLQDHFCCTSFWNCLDLPKRNLYARSLWK